jgi:hypothetical protein
VNSLKERLKKEGSQSVTICNRLKLPAADGKSYLTDVANAETLLTLRAGFKLDSRKGAKTQRVSLPLGFSALRLGGLA